MLPKANVDQQASPRKKQVFITDIFGGAEDPNQADEPKKKKKKKKKKTLIDSIF